MRKICFFLVFLLVFSFLSFYVPTLQVKASPDSATFQVANSIDDATHHKVNGWYTDPVYLQIYSHGTPDQRMHGGILFNDTTLPQGATINSANISVFLYTTFGDDANFVIYGHDVDDAPTFGSGENLTERTQTSASVSWVEDSLGTGWHNKTVTSIVQEIVDRPGWSSGNNMSILIITNSDVYKNFYTRSWDYDDHSVGPKLYVEYTSAVAPSPDNIGTTNDVAAESCKFHANWTAGSGSMSHYEFCHNNSGAWSNTTYSFDGVGGNTWSNQTITLNNTGGCLVAWEIKANNTGDVWNTTDVQYLWVWKPLPSVGKADLGESTYGSRSDVYYNGSSTGGKEAIYVAYLNDTMATGTYQVRAYDVQNYNWTDSCDIASGIDKDGHYIPALGYLPDGRLFIVYGYYATLKCRITTYSATTESNLTKLISNWGNEKNTPLALTTGQVAYGTSVCFDDVTLVFGRDGMSDVGNWTYMKFGNFSSSSIFVNANTSDRCDWSTAGSEPYLQDSLGDNIYSSSDVVEMGDFLFPNISSSDCEYIDKIQEVNLTIHFDCPSANLFDVYLWNGSTWSNIGSNPSTSGYEDWLIDISSVIDTTAKINNTKIYFKRTGGVTTSTIAKASIKYEALGWHSAQTLVYFPSITLYALPSKINGTSVFLSWHQNNVSKSVADRYADVYAIYSSDKGENWKCINGSSLSLPINGDSVLQVALPKTAVGTAVMDEKGKVAIPIIRNPQEHDIYYQQLAQYSTTLGQTGTWSTQNLTTLTGYNEFVPIRYMFNDTYYQRPSFWTTDLNTGKIQKFVRYGTETHKFKVVWQDDDHVNVTLGNKRFIQDAPSMFEMSFSETYENILSYLTVGSSQNQTSSGYLYGLNLTGQQTCRLLSAGIWQNPYGASTKWQAGLYNSTFHFVSNGSIADASPAERWAYWSSFDENASVVLNENYWLCWRVKESTTNGINYKYDVSAVVNQTFSYPLSWGADFPATISPVEYHNRTVTIKACSIHQTARGIGADYPMGFSNTGTNVSSPYSGDPVEFHTLVTDFDGLNSSKFYWNVTGAMLLNGTGSLTGTQDWANFSRVLPSSASDYVVHWKIGANDTNDDWSNTTSQYLTVLSQQNKNFSFFNAISVSSLMEFAIEKIVEFTEVIQVVGGLTFLVEMSFQCLEVVNVNAAVAFWKEAVAVVHEFFETVNPSAMVVWGKEKLWALPEAIQTTSIIKTLQELFCALKETINSLFVMDLGKESAYAFTSSVVPPDVLAWGKEKWSVLSETVQILFSYVSTQELLFFPVETVNILDSMKYLAEKMVAFFTFTETVTVQTAMSWSRLIVYGVNDALMLGALALILALAALALVVTKRSQ